jgi:tRNA A-37 threonylcarbamoyl transferase component Bud32
MVHSCGRNEQQIISNVDLKPAGIGTPCLLSCDKKQIIPVTIVKGIVLHCFCYREVCDAVGELEGRAGADVYCMDKCIVYPSQCPAHRCRCY